uniref:Peptidase S1 domain-containing protein n=1 Tax=Romanomermis culicivorax TaxID=13658 RepID=A0A915HHW5_ROMCU
MNRIPESEPSFPSGPQTYVCNRFALRPIILDEDFQIETTVEQMDIDESDYRANPHSRFHFYSHLLNIIYFQNRFLFPGRVYTYPLQTTALVHTLTAEELLDGPTSALNVEPADEELLDTLIFDLNIVKLPPSTDVLALPRLAPTADLTAMTTQIKDFLKLTLHDISTLALVPMDESTPVQPIMMDAETNTITDQTLTNMLKETTANQSTAMDVAPQEPAAMTVPLAPALDPPIYLATLAILPGPPIIATVAAARYNPQWQALAAALTVYHFPPPLHGYVSYKTKSLGHGKPPPQCGMNAFSDAASGHRTKRIIGGYTPEPYHSPWVGLLVKEGKVRCTAFLVSRNFNDKDTIWVLCAKHCFKDVLLDDDQDGRFNSTPFGLLFGFHDLRFSTQHVIYRTIDEVFIYPDEGLQPKDLVLIKLNMKVKFNSYINGLCLPNSADDHELYGDSVCITCGFGATKASPEPVVNSDILQCIEVEAKAPHPDHSLYSDWNSVVKLKSSAFGPYH